MHRLSLLIDDGTGSRSVFLSVLIVFIIVVALPPASALPDGSTVTYSLVHISDIQSITTHHKETADLTFAYLESLKGTYNISAIIVTGDVINTWDDREDWDAFAHARNLTTIPVYPVAGNHDTDDGYRYENYTLYCRKPGENYVSVIGDFDFIGINYVNGTYSPMELSRLRNNLLSSPRSHAIIATHYYMDENATLSPLGEDIDTFLIVKPTLVLMGHMHANFIRKRVVGGFPTVAGMTNYQDGISGGTTGLNYSAGTMYTVSSVNGQVETITAKIIHIYPDPSFGEETTVFFRDPDAMAPAGRIPATGIFPSSLYSCSGELFCIPDGFFRKRLPDIRAIAS